MYIPLTLNTAYCHISAIPGPKTFYRFNRKPYIGINVKRRIVELGVYSRQNLQVTNPRLRLVDKTTRKKEESISMSNTNRCSLKILRGLTVLSNCTVQKKIPPTGIPLIVEISYSFFKMYTTPRT